MLQNAGATSDHHNGTMLHERNIPGSGHSASYLMNCIEEAPVKVC